MRQLIICCDGTWNDAADRTHIFRIGKAAERMESPTIKVFYDKGVGTHFGQILRGGAVGKGLSKNIRQAYGWLVHEWQPDDCIFAFGFSRGAYTVRSLCGFLHFAGLLRPEDTGPLDKEGENKIIEEAYEAYRVRDKKQRAAQKFLSSTAHHHTRQPRIRFLGVFDTVGALGVPTHWVQDILNLVPKLNVEFHDDTLSEEVETACHALAVDERRGPFKPTLWTGQPRADQSVKQVWFSGVHSDVGGGYEEKALAEISLRWMLNEAKAAGVDLWPGFSDDPLSPNPAVPAHDSMDPKYLAVHRLSPSIDPYDRPIGPQQRSASHPQVPGEVLHWSVKDRIEGEAAHDLKAKGQVYAPLSLTKEGRFADPGLPVLDDR
jgi:uncharacterized protein (DUF2235 family)